MHSGQRHRDCYALDGCRETQPISALQWILLIAAAVACSMLWCAIHICGHPLIAVIVFTFVFSGLCSVIMACIDDWRTPHEDIGLLESVAELEPYTQKELEAIREVEEATRKLECVHEC